MLFIFRKNKNYKDKNFLQSRYVTLRNGCPDMMTELPKHGTTYLVAVSLAVSIMEVKPKESRRRALVGSSATPTSSIITKFLQILADS
jgi:hypothetical protein